MKKLAPDDWFEFHTKDMPRICTYSPAAIEIVVELFNGDSLAYPHIPHAYAIPRLMTHLWRKQLSKDTDVFFTVNMGPSFWSCSMHKPLAVLTFLIWIMFQTT